jgi:1-acyl-sn-glycerol-3-phosphate acyltransferase
MDLRPAERLRIAWRFAQMLFALLACLPGHFLWRLFGRRSPWPRLFLGWIGWIAGARIRCDGIPIRSRVLFVSNHVSWLDIMIVAGATGAAFVSRDDVARWPLFGWLARLNNTIFVARASRGTVHDQAAALRDALQSGQPVALFPEGTTEGGVDVLPFRASLLAAVVPAPDEVKLQPLAIDYGDAAHDIAWTGDEAAATNAGRLLARRGTLPVALHFLEPIDPTEVADRKALAALARERIVARLEASANHADLL